MMTPAATTRPEERSVADAAATVYLAAPASDRLAEGRRLAAWIVEGQETADSRAARGVHPDVIEMLPPEGKERIGIAQVRDVIRSAQFAPVEARHKVCLIPIAEALTLEAANALLKILEEPPRGLRFILLAEHPSDLLPTIVSRSRLMRIPTVPRAEIVDGLVSAGYSEPGARWISRLPFRDGELERLSSAPVDVEEALGRTAHLLADAQVQDLIDLMLGDDPILRRQAFLSLLERIARRDGDVLTVGVRILSAQTRESLVRMLHEFLVVTFELVRQATVPSGLTDVAAERARTALGVHRLHEFCLAINDANRSMTVYGPTDGILLSLFLICCEGDDRDV